MYVFPTFTEHLSDFCKTGDGIKLSAQQYWSFSEPKHEVNWYFFSSIYAYIPLGNLCKQLIYEMDTFVFESINHNVLDITRPDTLYCHIYILFLIIEMVLTY